MTESVGAKLNLGGQKIYLIRSEFLPARTMVLSPDLYDLIADDGAAAKKAHADTLAAIKAFDDLVAKR